MKNEKFVFKNLGTPLGYLFTLVSGAFLFSNFINLWAFGIYGYIFNTIGRHLLYYIDYKTSNAMEYNMMILEKNGYPAKETIKNCIKSTFKRSLIFGPFYYYLTKGAEPRFDLDLIIKIIIGLVITEVYFSVLHRIMHVYYPHLHKLHHCCVRACFTANLIFDQLDFFIEFSAPALILMILNKFILGDTWAFLMSVSVMNTWYGLDHDEYIKLPHWRHHQYIDSVYHVYLNSKTFEEKDQLKNMIKRN